MRCTLRRPLIIINDPDSRHSLLFFMTARDWSPNFFPGIFKTGSIWKSVSSFARSFAEDDFPARRYPERLIKFLDSQDSPGWITAMGNGGGRRGIFKSIGKRRILGGGGGAREGGKPFQQKLNSDLTISYMAIKPRSKTKGREDVFPGKGNKINKLGEAKFPGES